MEMVMMQFEKFNDLSELLRTYCKACDDDPGVHAACEHLVAVFDAAMLEDDPRAAFIEQLKKDAGYSSWRPS